VIVRGDGVTLRRQGQEDEPLAHDEVLGRLLP
jgi:hypothetical protein